MRTPLRRFFHSLILKPRLLLTTLLLAATHVCAQPSPTLSEIRSSLQEPVTIIFEGVTSRLAESPIGTSQS